MPLAYPAGRPVVATEAGGLVEQVLEGLGGALGPVDDAPAFADAILRVAGDLERQSALAIERATSWDDVLSAAFEAGAVSSEER